MLPWRRLQASLPGPRARLLVAVVVVFLLSLSAYLAGARYFGAAMDAYREAERELASHREEVSRLRQELVNREVAEQVDSASLEAMRQLVAELQSQIARKEEELGLYRTLLDDHEEPTGLQVDSLTLRRAPGADSFQYRIVVRRRAHLSESVDVSVSLSIDGQRQGELASIPFNEADLTLNSDALSIRFRYFKVLRGTFVLPADFVPAKVVLTVMEENDPGTLRIVDFPWQLTEF